MIAALLAVAAAATHPLDVPATFEPLLPSVRAHTAQAVLLPQRMPVEGPVYPSGEGYRTGWFLSVTAAPRCGADACFVATFEATTQRRPWGPRRVRLARGRTGWFKPLTCGGSCSPPSIEWRERGATYAIQAAVGTRRTERRILVGMADSAIRRGPR